MNTHNTPAYLVSAFESELERLRVGKNFVTDISVFNVDSKEDGMCKHKLEDGKKTGFLVTIKEEKSKRASKRKIYQAAKHVEQYFKKGEWEVEEVNPTYNGIEAYLYGVKRMIEEDLKAAYRNMNINFFKRVIAPL